MHFSTPNFNLSMFFVNVNIFKIKLFYNILCDRGAFLKFLLYFCALFYENTFPMKKIAVLFYALAVTTLLVAFTQCKKEPVCELVLRVHTSTTGADTAAPLPGAYVRIGLEDNYADFAKAEGYTDKNGVFTHTFKYEAVLDVIVSYDTTYYVDEVYHRDAYYGTGRVKLVPDETVDQVLLVMPAE